MTPEKPGLTPQEAGTVLAAAAKLEPDQITAAVRQVAAGQPITVEQRENLETIAQSGQSGQIVTATIKTAKDHPGTDQQPLGRRARQRERDFAVTARRQLILEMRFRHPPVTIRDIGKKLGISTTTVMLDLKAIRTSNAKLLNCPDGRDLLAETLAKFELIAAKCMTLADSHAGTQAKTGFIRAATTALEAKNKLMLDAGIIERAPARTTIEGPNGGPVTISQTIDATHTLSKRDKIAALNAAQDAKKAQ